MGVGVKVKLGMKKIILLGCMEQGYEILGLVWGGAKGGVFLVN